MKLRSFKRNRFLQYDPVDVVRHVTGKVSKITLLENVMAFCQFPLKNSINQEQSIIFL